MTESLAEVQHLLARIDRIEARQAISDLSARYALAIDSRNVSALVELFVEDVDCGRWGTGRGALAAWFEQVLRSFYRTVHFPGLPVVDFQDSASATAWVYSRAEHEDRGHWVVMAICYQDQYERRQGSWYFKKRKEHHWYSADVNQLPTGPDFQNWPGNETHKPRLPQLFPSWRPFWDRCPPELVDDLTIQP